MDLVDNELLSSKKVISTLEDTFDTENSSEENENIEKLLQDTREVLKRTTETSKKKPRYPYKYKKDEAIDKIQEIACDFTISEVDSLQKSPKTNGTTSMSHQVTLRAPSTIFLDSNSSGSEDELLVVSNSKPCKPHLQMRKELRQKAKLLKKNKNTRDVLRNYESDLENMESANSTEVSLAERNEKDIDSDSSDCVPSGDPSSFNSVKDIIEQQDGGKQIVREKLIVPLDTTNPQSLSELSYVKNVQKTFGKILS